MRASGLAHALDATVLSQSVFSGGAISLSAPASTVPAGARVYLSDMLTGECLSSDAQDDGSFVITLPVSDSTETGHYLINYATENTADSPESDRKFSPSLKLTVDGDDL